jgi:hypothetical protein
MRHLSAFPSIAFAAAWAFVLPAAGQVTDAPQIQAIARGRDHYVHAIPVASTVAEKAAEGLILVHTVASTGVMKPLVTSGPALLESIPPDGRVTPARERLAYLDRRIVGVAVDAERIYALVDESPVRPVPPSRLEGAGPVVPPKRELLVFWREDGTRIHRQEFPIDPRERQKLEATLNMGPLELVASGVKVFGETVQFDGRSLILVDELRGRRFTLPPVDLDDRFNQL